MQVKATIEVDINIFNAMTGKVPRHVNLDRVKAGLAEVMKKDSAHMSTVFYFGDYAGEVYIKDIAWH